jgi:hypothetical protein
MRYVRSPPSGLNDSIAKPAFFIAPAMNPFVGGPLARFQCATLSFHAHV